MKVSVIIEHDDGVIWEYTSTHDEIKTTFKINSEPGERYNDGLVWMSMPDYLIGYEIKFDPEVDRAEIGTYIELRKHFADHKTADMIFELNGEVDKLKSEKRRLAGKLDTVKCVLNNYEKEYVYEHGADIYEDILDALDSEEIK